jgi:hypothetical protein
MLKFGLGNSKLPPWIAILDLPAGHSCPFAYLCCSSANRTTGKITDGPHTEFRCYAASQEAIYGGARKRRWDNFNALRACKTMGAMVELILAALPNSPLARPHSAGDFFSQMYFDAWLEVARRRPNQKFYAYTKALPFWIKRKGEIPDNFKLTASYGGTHDFLIEIHSLRSARVVESEQQAAELGLQIDHDDALAYGNGGDFALLIHNTQPKGSRYAKAWAIVKKTIGGYGKKGRKKKLALAA